MLAGTRSITGCHGNWGHCRMLTVSETLLDARREQGCCR